MISTSIKLDGEQEFKKQLSDVNSNLKTLKSEMQLTTEEFKGQANSLDALEAKDRILTEQIAQQTEKVKALEDALENVGEVYKDQPKKIDEYQQSLNRAKTELVKMQRELDDNNKYLDEARSSADKAASSIDGFGKAVDDAGGKGGASGGGLKGLVGSLGDLKNVLLGGVVVTGVKELADAIFEIVDGTKEYRQIMGTLEVSSAAAGYTAEQTAEAYERLYGVLGDTQTAATTVANLQAIGLAQEDLMFLVDAASGAWATYGDSIPIDGLSESINETIQAGQVTGVFADVLNWAGTSEDAFNEKLAAANSTTERANIVLEELANQGLADTGQAWRDVNEDIVNANESQMKWDESVAQLGEFLSPAADALRSFGADAVEWVTEKLKGAVEWVQNLINAFQNLNSKLNSQSQSRMESYGYEAYYNEDGLLRYRQTSVSDSLAGSNVSEKPAATAADVYNAAAASVNAMGTQQASGSTVGTVETTINIDGNAIVRATTEARRKEDKSNPEVVSDSL